MGGPLDLKEPTNHGGAGQDRDHRQREQEPDLKASLEGLHVGSGAHGHAERRSHRAHFMPAANRTPPIAWDVSQ